jgi:hypothetical protein
MNHERARVTLQFVEKQARAHDLSLYQLSATIHPSGAVSEDLLGGAGKAEDAKLPGAGIIPKLCVMFG